MTKRDIVYCLLSIALLIYLWIAVSATNKMADEAPCAGVDIEVVQNNMATFVTAEVIDNELGNLQEKAATLAASDINLKALEDSLNAMPIVEKANCYRQTNDVIRIDVEPIVPVVRVFDPTESYYINKEGKRLTAELRYHMDLPVLIRETTSGPTPQSVVQLLQTIEGDNTLRQLVTAVKLDQRGDIILIPSIQGHVVNFGKTDGASHLDKFNRLFAFYKKVMPVKGWNYYDTISVKYAGQVVGIVRPGAKPVFRQPYTEEELLIFENEVIPGEAPAYVDSITPKPRFN